MLYCVVLCCVVLCCAVLCCAVLRCAVLCCVVLCCAVLCCVVLCCAVLRCAVLCCAVLCCVVLCCAVLRCAVLCCVVFLLCSPQSYPILLCSALFCSAVLPCFIQAYLVSPAVSFFSVSHTTLFFFVIIFPIVLNLILTVLFRFAFTDLKLNKTNLLGLNRTIAFRHAYSVESTSIALNLFTASCITRTVAMTSTIFSGGVLSTCIPDAARIGAISRGMDHWLAPNINSSRHPSSSRVTWQWGG